MKTHRVPVLATGRAGTRVNPLADLIVENIVPVARGPVVPIKARPNVLEDGLDVAEIFTAGTVVFPEHAVLSDGEHPLLIAGLDQDALKHDVEIKGLTGRMGVMPHQRSSACVKRKRRARVERGGCALHAAAYGHPRFRLRRSP